MTTRRLTRIQKENIVKDNTLNVLNQFIIIIVLYGHVKNIKVLLVQKISN